MAEEEINIPINLFNFDELVTIASQECEKIKKYFRLNIIFYQLITKKGLEFDKIVQYTPGDDVRRIDWKLYAKTKKLFIRTYKEERNFDIIIIVDVSNSMLLGTTKYTKNEYAAIVAAILGFAATESDNKVGGGVFSDRVRILLEPQNNCFHLLYALSLEENYGGKKDWEGLTNELLNTYSSDAIVFIISDFLSEDVYKYLPDISYHFSKVYGIMIRDPIDNTIPPGVGRVYLKDPHTGEVVLTNVEEAREEYEILNKRHIEKMSEMFHRTNQLFFKVDTTEDFGTSFINALGGEKVIIS